MRYIAKASLKTTHETMAGAREALSDIFAYDTKLLIRSTHIKLYHSTDYICP
jgi:hypothetical protein